MATDPRPEDPRPAADVDNQQATTSDPPGPEEAAGTRWPAVRNLLLRGFLVASCAGWGLLLGLLVWQPQPTPEPHPSYAQLGGGQIAGMDVGADEASLKRPATVHQLQLADTLLAQGNAAQVIKFYATLLTEDQSPLHDQMTYRMAIARELLGHLDAAMELYQGLVARSTDAHVTVASRLGQARCWLKMDSPEMAKAILAKMAAWPGVDTARDDGWDGEVFQMLALSQVPRDARAGPSEFDDLAVVAAPPQWTAMQLVDLARARESKADGEEQAPELKVIYRYGDDPQEIQVTICRPHAQLPRLLDEISQTCAVPFKLSPPAQEAIADRAVSVQLTNSSLAVTLDLLIDALDLVWTTADNGLQIVSEREIEADELARLRRATASRMLRYAIANYPEHPLAAHSYLALGNLSFENGDYAEAVSLYQQLAEQYPRSPVALVARFNHGKSLLQAGQHTAALEQFTRVVDLAHGSPLHSAAYSYVGRLHLENGQTAQAIRPLMRALSVAPADNRRAVPAVTLASGYLIADNPHAANLVLMAERDHVLQSPQAYVGELLGSLARFRVATEAVDVLQSGRAVINSLAHLSEQPFFGQHLYLLFGDALQATGLTMQMAELYGRTLDQPLPPWVRDHIRERLVQHWIEAGDTQPARELLEKVFADGSPDAVENATLTLAELNYDEGRLEECLAECRRLAASDLNHEKKTLVLRLMGRAYESRQEHYQAALCFAGMLPGQGAAVTDIPTETRGP